MAKTKVVIVGAGFAGLNAALSLRHADIDLLVLDKTNHHLFQPLLYQVASAALSPGNIAVPIREVLARQRNATVQLADTVGFDTNQKHVVAGNGQCFSYDYLVIATGARHSYFGHPDWEVHAPGLKTLNDALRIRKQIILSYERAERCGDAVEADRFMRFIVVGGGPTGVELAGSIAEIAHHTLVRNFRHIKPQRTKVFLIEGEDQILPAYPKDLALKGQHELEALGVEVMLNTKVTNITREGVWIGDHFLECPNVIWAAGNEASAILKTLNVPLDRAGRVIVQPDLSIPGHPEVFVVGDAASCRNKHGKPLPAIAPVAIQQGHYVAKIIRKRLATEKRPPFRYFDKGSLATIGKAKAVGMIGRLKLWGLPAWMAWCLIHILYLISFANKLKVMTQWFFLYIRDSRPYRLITRPVNDQDDPLKRAG